MDWEQFGVYWGIGGLSWLSKEPLSCTLPSSEVPMLSWGGA